MQWEGGVKCTYPVLPGKLILFFLQDESHFAWRGYPLPVEELILLYLEEAKLAVKSSDASLTNLRIELVNQLVLVACLSW